MKHKKINYYTDPLQSTNISELPLTMQLVDSGNGLAHNDPRFILAQA